MFFPVREYTGSSILVVSGPIPWTGDPLASCHFLCRVWIWFDACVLAWSVRLISAGVTLVSSFLSIRRAPLLVELEFLGISFGRASCCPRHW